jgi:two-component sensor histidine kinase
VIDLLWREEGGPPVAAPDREGFGSTLIKRAVEHELKGEVGLTFATEGVQCRLRFPVSDKIRVQP